MCEGGGVGLRRESGREAGFVGQNSSALAAPAEASSPCFSVGTQGSDLCLVVKNKLSKAIENVCGTWVFNKVPSLAVQRSCCVSPSSWCQRGGAASSAATGVALF